MSSESTDAKLVKRVQKGDKGAFDLLVLKYQHKIVNLVMRYVRDPEQALEVHARIDRPVGDVGVGAPLTFDLFSFLASHGAASVL